MVNETFANLGQYKDNVLDLQVDLGLKYDLFVSIMVKNVDEINRYRNYFHYIKILPERVL